MHFACSCYVNLMRCADVEEGKVNGWTLSGSMCTEQQAILATHKELQTHMTELQTATATVAMRRRNSCNRGNDKSCHTQRIRGEPTFESHNGPSNAMHNSPIGAATMMENAVACRMSLPQASYSAKSGCPFLPLSMSSRGKLPRAPCIVACSHPPRCFQSWIAIITNTSSTDLACTMCNVMRR